MKTKLIFGILLCINISLIGQINTFLKTFSATPGYSTTAYFVSGLDTLSKNSFVSCGVKYRTTSIPNDTLLMDSYLQKTEVSGLTKWFRMYHINGYSSSIKDIKITSNKEIYAVGHTSEFGSLNGSLKHGIIMKTDSNGIVQWCRLYPRQKIYNIMKRSDGNLGVLASDSGGAYGKNLKLSLLNSSGNLIWCKRLFAPDSNYYGNNIREGINKSFVICSNYSLIILLDSNGNHLNDLGYNPSPPGHGFHNIVNFRNQCYYISGYSIYNSKLVSTITKTDASLNIIWHKCYQSLGGDSEFQNIISLSPNRLMTFCEPENYGIYPGLKRSGFAFFDTSGVFINSYLFSTDSVDVVPDELISLNNGKFIFTAFGSTQYFGIADTSSSNFCKQTTISWNNVSSTWPVNISKFISINAPFNYSVIPVYVYQPFDLSIEYYCSNGPTGQLDPTYASITENNKENNNITLFPQPCSDYLFINFNLSSERVKPINIELLNSLGQNMFNYETLLESKYLPIDVRNLPQGVYYLNIKLDSDKTVIKKVIVAKK